MALFYLRKTSWHSGQSSALSTIGFHLAGIRLLFFFFFFLLVSVSIIGSSPQGRALARGTSGIQLFTGVTFADFA